MSLNASDVIERAPSAVHAIVDGELVLLSPQNFVYYGAEGLGAEIWELVDGSRTVKQLIDEMLSKYDAPSGVIEQETAAYLETLVTSGLAVVRR